MARRHGLAPGSRYSDPLAATEAMTVLHATEAPTVHLALWARVDGVRIADVDRALYDDRTLVKQLAMRRTLFVFPRDLLAVTWGSASARVAEQQHKQLVKNVLSGGIAEDAEAWIAEASAKVLDVLAGAEAMTTRQIRGRVPMLDGRFTIGTPEKKWGGSFPIGAWVLGTLGAQGKVVRADNAGHWRLNKPTWTRAETWLGEVPPAAKLDEGYAELVRRWLWTFGPGTEADIVWWLGATKAAARRALAELGAEQVTLEDGSVGWVLADDPFLDRSEEQVEPWSALLPTLDPTVMGWKERSFYLDPGHTPYLFDTNGNAGNTAWWAGRIVGCWVQDPDAVVRVVLREDVGAEGRAALDAEAERLTAWLDGVRITNIYASQQMKQALLP